MVLGVKYWDKWKTNGFKFQVLRYLKAINFPFLTNLMVLGVPNT